MVYKLSNIGIQGNKNSIFTWDFRVVPDRFSWNLEFGPNDSYSAKHSTSRNFTCLKSAMETPQQCVESVQS